MLKTIKFLFAALIVIAAQEAYSQNASYQFQRITPADGLASTTVVDITQDTFGFIWIGSQDGVSRYNGRTFKHFRPNPNDSLSISSLDAEYITADNKGGIWVTITDQGLDYYDPEIEGFRQYRHEHGLPRDQRFIEVSVDDNGTVWAATDSSVYWLNPVNDRFEREEGQREGMIFRLQAYDDGELLFFIHTGSDPVIGRRNSSGEYSYEPVPRRLNPSGNHPYRMHILKDEEGNEWLVNQDIIAKKAADNNNWRTVNVQNRQCLSNLREAVLHGTEHLWVMTTESICRVDLANGSASIFRHDPNNPASILPIRSGAESRIFIDRQGILWSAQFAAGISRVDLYSGGFQLYNISNRLPANEVISVFEATDGTFWVGTRILGNSLVRFNRNGTVNSRYGTSLFDSPRGRTSGTQLSHPHVFSMAQTRDGSIWAATASTTTIFGGLNRIRPGSGTITRFKHDPNDTSGMPDNNIQAVAVDGSNRVWFLSSSESIHWINASNERITRVELPESDINRHNSSQFMYTDNMGDVWFTKSGRKGLFRIDHSEAEIYHLELQHIDGRPAGEINFIHHDDNDTYWVVTKFGFGTFNPETSHMISWYDDSNVSLPTNEIASIQSDEDGMIWLATIDGIVKFEPQSLNTTHFRYDRGLQGNIFSSTVSFRGRSGNIYFGGAGGLNVFDPKEIATNPNPPDITFSSLYLDGVEVIPGDDSPIDRSLLFADKITVDPDVTTITIEFASLHFANPDRNEYRYMLQGFDTDWRFGGTIGIATYTNLPPGSYIFRLMASNRDGVWSDGNTQIRIITVLPPWWRTWWAYTIYFFLFVIAVILVDRVQRRRLIQREREKTRERELEQAKQIEKAYHELETAHESLEKAHENLKITQEQLVQQEKLASLGQLTAGIAHEIKNPLNFVNNFSDVSIELVQEIREETERLRKKLINEKLTSSDDETDEMLELLDDLESNLKKIFEHGSRADNIVKSMLMHSRGGSGEIQKANINELLKESVNLVFHGMKASENPIDVDIQYEFDEDVREVSMITEEISRVIINLCNNAFDAMKDKISRLANENGQEDYQPKLIIRSRQKRDQVLFEIEDNGPGIPPDIKNKILQPFFTTKKGTQGTGLGLSITNDIIKMHRGSLQILSENGKTVFSIQLPENIEETKSTG
ncbi:MAG: GHKL domain-containing protein [Balneolaceae bacterium]|nr:MAG: GHKL domain-containing protein [Balneolaceae bacterium]